MEIRQPEAMLRWRSGQAPRNYLAGEGSKPQAAPAHGRGGERCGKGAPESIKCEPAAIPAHLSDRLLFRLIAELGLRVGEALSLQLEDPIGRCVVRPAPVPVLGSR